MKYLISLLLLGLTLSAWAAEIIRDPAYHVARGDALVQAKRWEEALVAYRLALALRPYQADAWAGIAQVHEQQHQTAEADAALAQAFRADGDCPAALLLRSERFLNKGQTAQAIADINQVIKRRPEFTRALMVRARLHLRQNQYDDAIQDITRYVAKNPTDIEAYRLRSQAYRQHGRVKEAIADLTHVIRLAPRDADAFVQRARHYEDVKNINQALADYSQALRLRPDDVDLYWQRAQLLYEQEKYTESLADLDRFLAKRSYHEEALFKRGVCHYSLRAPERALKDFLRVTSTSPKNLDAWLWLGYAYEQLERYPEALASFTRVLKIDPANVRGLLARAQAHDSLDQPKEALLDANAAITATNAETSTPHRVRGLILYHQGQWTQAEADFSKALELGYSTPWLLLVDRANARRRQGKLTDALADLDKAAELNANYSGIHTKRASLFVSQGKWAQAKAAHEKIVALPPTRENETTQAYSRVLILILDHKYAEGLKLAEEYVAKNPKDTSWLYDIACALAIGAEVASKDDQNPQAVALRRQLADRALELLELCVTLGYRNFVHLRHDWDFESLRPEPRFQKIAQPPAKS